MAVRWRLCASPDGSFYEELASPQVAFCWAYDSRADQLWEADHAAVGNELELDDKEVVLLSAFVRTGFWLQPGASRLLELALDKGEEAAADEEGVEADVRALSGNDSGPTVRLTLRLRDRGRLLARLHVCRSTGRAQLLRMRVAGDAEAWAFGAWGAEGLPAVVIHATASGARDLFRTDGVRPAGSLPPGTFAPLPGCLSSLAGAHFDGPDAPQTLAVERSRSGHMLVRISFNGRHAGLAILDTGASGFVITRAAADAAGMESFGEVFVSGVDNKIPSRFRRCASVGVGPLTFQAPLLLEMELAGLVWGASGPCVGIVGYDFFRRAVVDIPPAPATQLRVSAPAAWAPPPAIAWQWLQVALVANVPHAYARWHGVPDGSEPELLMLDSGAGGADAIFHARSVARLGLGNVGAYAGSSSIRGVSSSEAPRRMPAAQTAPAPTQRRQLDWLELLPSGLPGAQTGRPLRFQGVETLMLGEPGAFDLSETMSGVVCMPLLARSRVVVDLFRRRVAFVREGEIGEESGLSDAI